MYWPTAGGLEFGVWARRRRARFLRLVKSLWPAAGGLEFGVWARRRRALFLRSVGKCGPPQAGLILGVVNFQQQQAGLILTDKSSLTS